MVGRKFKLDNWSEVYTIAAFVSVKEITLDRAITDDADTELAYVIYNDELSLPADCGEIVCLRQEASYATLKKIGLGEMRSKQVESPFTSTEIEYNDPQYWSYLDDRSKIVVYPAPTRVIGIKVDYQKELTELSLDLDIPIIPVEFHEILIIGGMGDLLEYDDDIRLDRKNAEFDIMLRDLMLKNAAKTDHMVIRPYVRRT
jgi:hypothetical protein